MKNLDYFIHEVPAHQVQITLWDAAWEDGFLHSILAEIGWRGGTIPQIADEILRRKQEMVVTSPSQQ